MAQRPVGKAHHRRVDPCLPQPGHGVVHEIRVDGVWRFDKDLTHPLEDHRVDVSGDVSEICGDFAFDHGAVDDVAFAIDLVDYPYVPGDGDFLSRGRWCDECADLL